MLTKRLAKLEANRPRRGLSMPFLMVGLDPEVLARVAQAQKDGTFPKSLRSADLEAVLALADL